jgi:hypothetical protein
LRRAYWLTGIGPWGNSWSGIAHRVDFAKANGRVIAVETVNLRRPNAREREQSVYSTAFKFNDIHQGHKGKFTGFAVVSADEGDDIKNTMEFRVLQSAANVVDYNDPEEVEGFYKQIAASVGAH